MKIEHLLIVLFVIIVVLWIFKGRCSEGYGQDASIRAAAGWVAGPNYGFDPVQEFADQIAENREYIEQQRKKENFKAPTCNSCKNTEEFNY